MAAQVITGQSIPPVLRIATDSNFSLFFWNSKVILTVLAVDDRFELSLQISFVSWKKRMFRIRNSFVFLAFSLGLFPTCEYSHERIAKRSAPRDNWAIAISVCDWASIDSFPKIDSGR